MFTVTVNNQDLSEKIPKQFGANAARIALDLSKVEMTTTVVVIGAVVMNPLFMFVLN